MEASYAPLSTDTAPTDDVAELDTSITTVWSIKRAGFATLATFATFFYDLSHWVGGDFWLPFGVLTGTVLLVTAAYSFFWPRLLYRSWGYAVRQEEMYIQHGVLNHVRTVVPLRRIQHLDVSQDLLEREFSLGRLVVHTAGSRSSDVVIPGLPLNEAERIRDQIKRFILEDPLMEDPV